jgi:hypothetical protein
MVLRSYNTARICRLYQSIERVGTLRPRLTSSSPFVKERGLDLDPALEGALNEYLELPLRLTKNEGQFQLFGQEDVCERNAQTQESDGPLRGIRTWELPSSEGGSNQQPPYHFSLIQPNYYTIPETFSYS